MLKFFVIVLMSVSVGLVGCEDESSQSQTEVSGSSGTDYPVSAEILRTQDEVFGVEREINEALLEASQVSKSQFIALEKTELSFSSCLVQASLGVLPASDKDGYVIHLGGGEYYRLDWDDLEVQEVEHNQKNAPIAEMLLTMSHEAKAKALVSYQRMAVMRVQSAFQRHGQKVDMNDIPPVMKKAEIERQKASVQRYRESF